MNSSQSPQKSAIGQSKAPASQVARRKRLTIVGFTMVVVIIPFCLYYLFFVTSQTTYFSKRNFRVLAGIGDHISSKIDNLGTNLVNVAKKAKQDKSDKTKVEGKDNSDIKQLERNQAATPAADVLKVKEAVKLVPDLKFDPVQYQPTAQTKPNSKARTALQVSNSNTGSSSGNPTPPGANTNTGSNGAAPEGQRPATSTVPATGSEPRVTLSVRPEKGSFWLYLEYHGAANALPADFPVKSDLNILFEPFVSRYVIDELYETRERLFDEVVVAEQETGRVIFERGPAGLKVVTLDSLLNNKGGKLDLKLADQSSSLADVQIAGADYKLFLQPVRLTLSAATDDNRSGVRWVVCGLTRTDHFRDATFAVSYTLLIILAFVVSLAVLSWPLLKLKLMGAKDRVRHADLVLTLFSALVGTALVTFILLDLHTYLSLNDAADRHLEKLSEDIKSNFQKELVSALGQLRNLNLEIVTLAQKEQSGALRDLGDSITSPNVKSNCSSTPLLSSRANILGDGVDWKTAPYPYFNTVTWADPSGQQRIKWTTRSETTFFLDMSGRQFFKDTKDGNLWKLCPPGSDCDYTLQSVRSRNTGENVAVIATGVPGSPWVSTLDTRLLSLMGPVLPVGYGFAVVDNRGQVLFHSDEVKNLEEEFFAECENDRWLRAAVLARTDRLIDTNYLGKGHRMYVSPLAGTPWTLVAFVDKRMARTINLEVITLSFVLYLIFAASVSAVISLICLVRMIVVSAKYLPGQGDGIRWLWPDRKRARRYGLLIMSYALIGCVFALASIVASGLFLAICCVVLPLLAALLWWLILVKDPPARAVIKAIVKLRNVNRIVTGRLSYRTRYTIAIAGFLALASVLPAAGFFQIAHNFEMRLMVKHGQVSIARALEQRTQRVASQYGSIKIGGQGEQSLLPDSKEKVAFLKQRLEASSSKPNLDVYDSFFFDTTRLDTSQAQFDQETICTLDCWLLDARPLYDQSCVESQGLAAGASSDGLWRWKRDRDRHILLAKDKDGRNGEPSVVLMSSIPSILAPNSLGSWLRLILSLVLVVVLPYGLVRFVARRFFLLDMDLPPCVATLPHVTGLVRNYVLLRSPIAASGDESDRNKSYVSDLRSVRVWSEWTKEITSKPADLPVVLNNFEHCMDDPVANREKLLAIEHLLKSEKRVVVASTIDPLSFPLTPKPAGQAAANNGKIETGPSEPAALEGKQNGAADLKIEYHSSVPFSVAVAGKQNGSVDVNEQAPVPYLSETDIQARWAELFANFRTVCASDNSTPKFVRENPEFVDILKTKKPWRYIEGIGKGIVKNWSLHGKNSRDPAKIEELISEVAEQAQPYHQALWNTCSEGQRCTLIHLAQDGMISPKNKHVRRLVKRGLVARDPGLRLMDESFRRFVNSVSHEQDVEGWRQQEGGSAWQLLRAPLLLILAGVALFLFITQKDNYDSTISFMSAIAAGIAALFRLLGMFQKDKGGSAIQS